MQSSACGSLAQFAGIPAAAVGARRQIQHGAAAHGQARHAPAHSETKPPAPAASEQWRIDLIRSATSHNLSPDGSSPRAPGAHSTDNTIAISLDCYRFGSRISLHYSWYDMQAQNARWWYNRLRGTPCDRQSARIYRSDQESKRRNRWRSFLAEARSFGPPGDQGTAAQAGGAPRRSRMARG